MTALANEIAASSKGKLVLVEEALEFYAEWLRRTGKPPSSVFGSIYTCRRFFKEAKVGHLPVSELDETHISVWLNRPGRAGEATRIRDRMFLHAFLKFCFHKGWSLSIPTFLSNVRRDTLTQDQKQPKHVRPVSDYEFNQMLEVCKDHQFWRFAMICSRDTGLRLGDIATLEWSSITRTPGVLSVSTSKTGAIVEVPISPRLAVEVSKLKQGSTKYVFPYEASVALGPRRCILSVRFAEIRKMAGVHGVSFHGLRHAFITEKAAQGNTKEFIAGLVGHSSTATTAGYLHNPQSLQEEAFTIECGPSLQSDQPKNEILASFSSTL